VAHYTHDDPTAQDRAYNPHSELPSVRGRHENGGRWRGGAARARLASTLEHDRAQLGGINAPPALRTIGTASYVGGVYSLDGAAGDAELALLQDWAPAARTLAENRRVLLWTGVLTLAGALIATFAFSRRVTGPLSLLARVADDVARGHWEQRVPVNGPAEARTMAQAFNHMTATLTHWHTEAIARERELQGVNDRFRAVTDSANDAIVSTDADGTILFWNHRAEVVFGYSGQEAIGRPIALILPGLAEAPFPGGLMDGEAPGTAGLAAPIEVDGRRRNGTNVPLEISLSTWTAESRLFYTGIIRDITERRQAAATLRDRDEQLRHAQKMEAIGQLAGGVAHDFNNLLTGMLGYTDLALAKVTAGDSVRADLLEIQKAGRMAASLTHDLLAFGRKQVLQPVVLDVNAVVRDAINLIRHLVGERIDVVLDLDPQLRAIRADRTQLTQVLLNLAANARDAMPSGGRLTLTTRHDDAGQPPRVTLAVSDTGTGMSEDVKSRIFEPFFTTKAVGKGTGLGLATAYGVVAQSGGTIQVESVLGRGTAFHLAFPVADVRPAAEAAAAPGVPVTQGSETVLLVEDNDGVRTMASDALRGAGYAVVAARDGEEALRLTGADLDRIAVVLTDVVMPVMGGRELAGRLRAARPDIKIIFMSGYTDDAIVSHHVRDSATAFIQKPFVPSALGRAVRQVLDRDTIQ
jgi:PAS domain S-box-containing protein